MTAVPEWLSHEVSLMLPLSPDADAWYKCSKGDWESERFRRCDWEALRAAEDAGAEHCVSVARAGADAERSVLAGALDMLRLAADRIDGGAEGSQP